MKTQRLDEYEFSDLWSIDALRQHSSFRQLLNNKRKMNAVISDLVCMLKSSDVQEYSRGMRGLAAIGESSVSSLRSLLTHSKPTYRQRAISVLETIGTQATWALPDIVRAFEKDRSIYVRRRAATALGSFPPQEAIIQSLRNSKTSDKVLRRLTRESLERLYVAGG